MKPQETYAYRIDTLNQDELNEVCNIYAEENEDNFLNLFDDNGEEASWGSLLLLEDFVDGKTKTREWLEKNAHKLFIVVFDNEEDANVQAEDGGLTTYYRATNRFIVSL